MVADRIDPNGKIVTLGQLEPRCEEARRSGQDVVFTNGHFELLHPGHVRYLEQARSEGDLLIVGLNGDGATRRLKGAGRPVLEAAARAEVLAALSCVDYVVVFEEDTAEALVQKLRPAVYVKGGDYEHKPLPEAEIVRAYGGRVVLVPLVSGYSTSKLIRQIAAECSSKGDA
jgi:rfaE bifunctional protein nucleotidyltransferase chain/domain